MRASRALSAASVALVLTLGACSSGERTVTAGCGKVLGRAVPVGGIQRMTVEFGDRGATVWFDRRWWGSPAPTPPRPLSLHGTMTLERADAAVFHADDGWTFAFAPTIVGCQ